MPQGKVIAVKPLDKIGANDDQQLNASNSDKTISDKRDMIFVGIYKEHNGHITKKVDSIVWFESNDEGFTEGLELKIDEIDESNSMQISKARGVSRL